MEGGATSCQRGRRREERGGGERGGRGRRRSRRSDIIYIYIFSNISCGKNVRSYHKLWVIFYLEQVSFPIFIHSRLTSKMLNCESYKITNFVDFSKKFIPMKIANYCIARMFSFKGKFC